MNNAGRQELRLRERKDEDGPVALRITEFNLRWRPEGKRRW